MQWPTCSCLNALSSAWSVIVRRLEVCGPVTQWADIIRTGAWVAQAGSLSIAVHQEGRRPSYRPPQPCVPPDFLTITGRLCLPNFELEEIYSIRVFCHCDKNKCHPPTHTLCSPLLLVVWICGHLVSGPWGLTLCFLLSPLPLHVQKLIQPLELTLTCKSWLILHTVGLYTLKWQFKVALIPWLEFHGLRYQLLLQSDWDYCNGNLSIHTQVHLHTYTLHCTYTHCTAHTHLYIYVPADTGTFTHTYWTYTLQYTCTCTHMYPSATCKHIHACACIHTHRVTQKIK